jgi:hypothetical protein
MSYLKYKETKCTSVLQALNDGFVVLEPGVEFLSVDYSR